MTRLDPRAMIGHTLEGLKILDAHRSPETQTIRLKLDLLGLAYKHEGVVIDDLGEALREIGHKPWIAAELNDDRVRPGERLVTQFVVDHIQREIARCVQLVTTGHVEYAEVSLERLASNLADAQLTQDPPASLVGGF